MAEFNAKRERDLRLKNVIFREAYDRTNKVGVMDTREAALKDVCELINTTYGYEQVEVLDGDLISLASSIDELMYMVR